jgi:hypothetical protein
MIVIPPKYVKYQAFTGLAFRIPKLNTLGSWKAKKKIKQLKLKGGYEKWIQGLLSLDPNIF